MDMKYLDFGRAMKKHLKDLLSIDNPVIFDIGCNDGSDTLEFINLFPDARVYAFEGDYRAARQFKEKVNSINVSLIECLVSDKEDLIPFYYSNSNTRRKGSEDFWSASSSIKKPQKHLEVFEDVRFEKPVMQQTKSLDWLKENLFLPQPNILWIDVNGAESEVINGGRKTLKRVDLIVIEFEEVELFTGSLTQSETLKMLPDFELVEVYNFYGNFGNLLLQRKS
jgi:2-O-methyltransferase